VKLISAFCALLTLAFVGCQPQGSIPQGVQVFFSPRGGVTEAVTNVLAQATNSILVQAYSFTSAPIAEALVAAHRRGVKVQVILDHSQRTEKYSEADFLIHAGIPTLIDAQHAIAHNKIMIIDGYTVLTGSFNFTKAAEEKNAENLLVINDPVLATKYTENWRLHQQHSEPYQRGGAAAGRDHHAHITLLSADREPSPARSNNNHEWAFGAFKPAEGGVAWSTTRRSADFQSVVSPISNRQSVQCFQARLNLLRAGTLETCDTADWKSALRSWCQLAPGLCQPIPGGEL